MKALGGYILSVTAASVLFGILNTLLDKKGGITLLLRLIGGIFLVFTIIAPVSDVNLDGLLDIPIDFAKQGNAISSKTQETIQNQLHDNIKTQCEAYILDKAKSCQILLDVDVTLSDGDLPIPVYVNLHGRVSPYVKNLLQDWIAVNMGISKENQVWSG